MVYMGAFKGVYALLWCDSGRLYTFRGPFGTGMDCVQQYAYRYAAELPATLQSGYSIPSGLPPETSERDRSSVLSIPAFQLAM